jgi:hypothetical protein
MAADGGLGHLKGAAQVRYRELVALQYQQQPAPGGVGQRLQAIENRCTHAKPHILVSG